MNIIKGHIFSQNDLNNFDKQGNILKPWVCALKPRKQFDVWNDGSRQSRYSRVS